jgi:hypothetical protein
MLHMLSSVQIEREIKMLKQVLLAISGDPEYELDSHQRVNHALSPRRVDDCGIIRITECGLKLRHLGYQPNIIFHTNDAVAYQSARIMAAVLDVGVIRVDSRLDDMAVVETPKAGQNKLRDAFRTSLDAYSFFKPLVPLESTGETIMIVRSGGWGMTFGKDADGRHASWPCSQVYRFDIEEQKLEFVCTRATSI